MEIHHLVIGLVSMHQVMAALMLHLDCQECKVALGRSQDILLELVKVFTICFPTRCGVEI